MLPMKRRQQRKPAHKLEPEVVVAVVLQSPNREIAAERLGVNGSNLRRLMQREEYRAAFEEAKRAVLDDAINQLRVFGGEAARTLREVMNEPINPPAARASAARGLLELLLRAVETQDLAVRVAALEAGQNKAKEVY